METLQELIVTVRRCGREMGVPEKEAAGIRVFAENRVVALVDAHADMLARMARGEWGGVFGRGVDGGWGSCGHLKAWCGV